MCSSVVVLLRPDFPPLMHQRKTVSLSSKTHGMSQEIKGTKRQSGEEKGLIMTTSLLVPVMVAQSFGSQDHVDRMSSDDGTCRIWDARYSQFNPRLCIPKPPETAAGKNTGPLSSTALQSHQIFCCAFNNSGTFFVTGSSDTCARISDGCQGENLVRRWQSDIHIHELIDTPNLLEEK